MMPWPIKEGTRVVTDDNAKGTVIDCYEDELSRGMIPTPLVRVRMDEGAAFDFYPRELSIDEGAE
jgi:hypothetical protein